MFANKNFKLAFVALVMLSVAAILLTGGLSYQGGYSAALSDLTAQAMPSESPPTEVSEISPTPIYIVATLPPDTPAPTVEVPTAALPTSTTASDPAPTVNVPPPPPAATSTPQPTATSDLGQVQASIVAPNYLAEGRWAEVMIRVDNISVGSGVATGYHYLTPNPGGHPQFVTIFETIHDEVPLADVDPDAPLWIGWVRFTDGKQFYFPAGCFYVETVEAEGWEPIGPDPGGFHWEVHWTGGFYDCANSTDKIPHTPLIMPGQSAVIPMYVYIQHPRLWLDNDWGPPDRRIAYIGVEMRDGTGRSLGIVAEYFGE